MTTPSPARAWHSTKLTAHQFPHVDLEPRQGDAATNDFEHQRQIAAAMRTYEDTLSGRKIYPGRVRHFPSLNESAREEDTERHRPGFRKGRTDGQTGMGSGRLHAVALV